MKIENRASIAAAIGFLALGMWLSLTTTVSQTLLDVIFALGMALLYTSLYKQLKYGEGIEQDERTNKLMRYALSGSWSATIVFLTAIIMADEFGLATFSVRWVLSTTFFFMVFTFIGLKWYYERKGDVK